MTLEANAAGFAHTPQPLLSVAARAAAALGVAALVGAAWLYAEKESRVALQSSTAALTAVRVTLPPVEIVADHGAAAVAAAGALALRDRGARPALLMALHQ